MNKNKWMLIVATFVLAIGSAFVTKEDSTKALTSYFENIPPCMPSSCSSSGNFPCGHIVWTSGCETQVLEAFRN